MLTREELWDWYNDTMSTRLMSDTGAIIIIQCMTGDTPVLMGDGSWKSIADIKVGDRIATYDNGKLTSSVVKHLLKQGQDRIYQIRMKSGRSVRATFSDFYGIAICKLFIRS